MNNKRLVWLALLVVALVIGVYWLAHKSSSYKPKASNSYTAQKPAWLNYEGKQACDLFTLSQAKTTIGADAKQLAKTPLVNRATSETSLTTCPYTTAGGSATSQANYQTATLEVHYAKDTAGQTANQKGYSDAQKLGTSTALSGLGDQAFYNTTYGQLNVLKGNYWLVATNSTVTPSGLSYSQDNATKIIQAALQQL